MLILLILLAIASILAGPAAAHVSHIVIHNKMLTKKARLLLLLLPPAVPTLAAILFSLVLMSSTVHLPENIQEIPNTQTRGNQIGLAIVIVIAFSTIYFGVLNSCLSHFGNKELPQDDEE